MDKIVDNLKEYRFYGDLVRVSKKRASITTLEKLFDIFKKIKFFYAKRFIQFSLYKLQDKTEYSGIFKARL